MNSFIVKNNIDKNYLNKYSLYPKKIHAGIFMLCVKGNAVVSINLRQHNVKENDFIVLLPDSITHVLSLSDDVLFYYVGVSKEHLTNLDFIKSTINIYPIMIDHPVLPMDAPIAQLYKEGYLLLNKASALSKNCISHNKELIVALLTIILQGTTELYAQHKEWVNCQHNRTYELSRKFIQLVIDNYPEGKVEYFEAVDNPEDENSKTHMIPFSKHLYIEREDFMETPVKGYHRLYIGNEVRLKYAYYVKATSVEKDENGKITVIHATYDPESRGGTTPDGRKVKGTSHWVDASSALKVEVRQYDKLFKSEVPGANTGNYLDDLNPDSLIVLNDAYVEEEAKNVKLGEYLQFIRNGYYILDKDTTEDHLVFNRTCTLKDSWSKEKAKMGL